MGPSQRRSSPEFPLWESSVQNAALGKLTLTGSPCPSPNLLMTAANEKPAERKDMGGGVCCLFLSLDGGGAGGRLPGPTVTPGPLDDSGRLSGPSVRLAGRPKQEPQPGAGAGVTLSFPLSADRPPPCLGMPTPGRLVNHPGGNDRNSSCRGGEKAQRIIPPGSSWLRVPQDIRQPGPTDGNLAAGAAGRPTVPEHSSTQPPPADPSQSVDSICGHSRTQEDYSAAAGSSLRVHAVRFGPGQELLGSLQAFVEERRTPSAVHHHLRWQRHQGNAPAGQRHGNQQERDLTKNLIRKPRTFDPVTPPCELLIISAFLLQVLHLSGRFEIVSLVGTLNRDAHLHISLSDAEGRTVGGHVLGDLEVFTTAEVVVGEAADLQFSREMDERTGFPELVVQPALTEP
ncbi:hypothetical protein L3Q82_001498 [Scortum barcoo]|uniref:Uncharacterized protein n=1 Tax=Scortum barcoo TaxID=214431 RepID=A0ACB8W8C7_9TELE|nr:hypothetical protein L3Q82_001498 [Scortum barcoo]